MAKIFTPVKCKGVNSRVITSAWGQHPSFTALAIAREGGTVSFFQEEVRALRALTPEPAGGAWRRAAAVRAEMPSWPDR